ncbi:hypothetical protein AcW2_000369 [Taiwanofungus camphoratus]|nr:hypothetical protein AcW2_000369 [Antrodia cinnamomea]
MKFCPHLCRTCPDDPAVGTVCNVRVKLTSSSVSWIRARLMTLTYIHIHVESSGRERCKDSTGLFARRNCALEPGAKTQVSPFHGDLKLECFDPSRSPSHRIGFFYNWWVAASLSLATNSFLARICSGMFMRRLRR